MKEDVNQQENRYSRMRYVCSGESGLKLPVVSLGGWHHFGERERATALCLRAFDLGITHFDLANNYGPPPGRAEEVMGEILRGPLAAHRDELLISTKAGYHMWRGPYGEWGSRKHLLASLDQSLRRLGLAYVDIFYSHRYDPITPLEETIGALAQAVRTGKALYAGISNYPAEVLGDAARLARDAGCPLVIHQCEYSMLRRGIEDSVLRKTAKRGMGMIVYSPLAQGLLTSKYLEGVPEDSRAAQGSGFLEREVRNAVVLAKLRKLNILAQDLGMSLAQFALLWCLRRPEITSVLVGASQTTQLEETAAVASMSGLTGEVIDMVDEILREAL